MADIHRFEKEVPVLNRRIFDYLAHETTVNLLNYLQLDVEEEEKQRYKARSLEFAELLQCTILFLERSRSSSKSTGIWDVRH
jgi:hypothetical protein